MAVRSATVFEFCWNRRHVFFIFERAERREQVKGEEGEGEGERGRELRGAERGKKRRGPTSAAAANGGDGGGQKGARETERERANGGDLGGSEFFIECFFFLSLLPLPDSDSDFNPYRPGASPASWRPSRESF